MCYITSVDLDQKIKQAIQTWQEQNYEGASPVTRRLLEFWFKEEHLLKDGAPLKFWRCQREAIEALIYVYEVCGYRSLYDLARGFGVSIPVDPTRDLWPKYCFKMATGSGKTWVMALALVWQYFNKLFGTSKSARHSSHFLLIAPNLIVLDRLTEAFADNRVFNAFPFIPAEWRSEFDLQLILQSQPAPKTSKGVLHLTNWQQFHKEREREMNPAEEELGPPPKKEEELVAEALLANLSAYDDLVVMNDEAHHVHSDELKWSEAVETLHQNISQAYRDGLVMQLDFTATPKDLTGNLFPHIVYNYPLAEAIRDGIVKRPHIGEIENVPVSQSRDFVERNQIQIDTAVEILKEFKKEFKASGKKPVLFVMTDVTKNADKVGQYLERHGFGQKVLVIHTDTKGVITKKDLAKAREVARKIDSPENPYEAIVSVMMLKEGWDVRNVCVIVPLRAFDSPILPEQTLGRGLRRMCPQDETWQERLIVIDHPRFRQLWQAEIESGELIVDITPVEKVYEPSNPIMVNPKRLKFDIEIPVIQGGVSTTTPDLAKFDIEKLPRQLFRLSEIDIPKVMYRERDLLEKKIVREKTLAFDYTESFSLYLSYIVKAVLSKAGVSGLFSELVPKVREYIEKFLFDHTIDGEDIELVRKLNYIPVREKLVELFAKEINSLSRTEKKTALWGVYRVSETQPLHTSEPVCRVEKSVFDRLPYPRRYEFEKRFMQYLDDRREVRAFTKVLPRFPMHLPYYSHEGYLRHYTPDFVVRSNGSMYLVETKGMEGVDIPLKDRAALLWCESASRLTGEKWLYLKVTVPIFDECCSQNFKTLAATAAYRR